MLMLNSMMISSELIELLVCILKFLLRSVISLLVMFETMLIMRIGRNAMIGLWKMISSSRMINRIVLNVMIEFALLDVLCWSKLCVIWLVVFVCSLVLVMSGLMFLRSVLIESSSEFWLDCVRFGIWIAIVCMILFGDSCFVTMRLT